jgi:hypothetical protein
VFNRRAAKLGHPCQQIHGDWVYSGLYINEVILD